MIRQKILGMSLVRQGKRRRLAISAISVTALVHFAFVLLNRLLIAFLGLPQTLILWNEPELSGWADHTATAEGVSR